MHTHTHTHTHPRKPAASGAGLHGEHTPKHILKRRRKVARNPYLRMAVSPCLTVMLSVPRLKSTLRTGSPVGRRQSNLSRTRGNCLRSGWALATMVATPRCGLGATREGVRARGSPSGLQRPRAFIHGRGGTRSANLRSSPLCLSLSLAQSLLPLRLHRALIKPELGREQVKATQF